jgi:hypothetical protein
MTVYLECNPDETLAVSLGVTRKQIVHTDDKGRVCDNLSKRDNVIGMVDEDPFSAQPSYLKKLVQIKNEHGIKVLLDRKRQNKMVVICPRLEEWLIKTTHLAGLKMSDFALSENPRNLHSEINQRLGSLRKLLDKLKEVNSIRLEYLGHLLIGPET